MENIIKNSSRLYQSDKLDEVLSNFTSEERELYYDILDSNDFKSSGDVFESLKGKMYALEIFSSKGNSIQRAKSKIFRQLTVVKSFELRGYSSGMYYLALECLDSALFYQMYDIASELSRILGNHYFRCGNAIEGNIRYDDCKKYNSLNQLEIEAEFRFYKTIHLVDSGCQLNDNLKKEVYHMTSLVKTNKDSHRLHFFYYMLKVMIEDEIVGKIKICKSALDYFENLFFRHSTIISIFRKKLVIQYIELGKFALAENIANFQISEPEMTNYEIILQRHKLAFIKYKMGDSTAALDILRSIDKSEILMPVFADQLNIDIIYLEILTSNRGAEDKVKVIKYCNDNGYFGGIVELEKMNV